MKSMALAALLLVSAFTQPRASAAEEDAAAIAVVRRYVHQKKHWRASDYQIRRDRVEGRRTVFHVTYLPDRKRAPMVGGGKSFEAFYDPARQKVTQVLYFQ